MKQQVSIFMTLEQPIIQQQQQKQKRKRNIVNPKKVNKIKVNCVYCSKEFQVWKSRLEKARKRFNGNISCSRKCYIENRGNSKHSKHFFCNHCAEWITKDQAILKTKGTIIIYSNYRKYPMKRDNYYCPKCSNKVFFKLPKNTEKKRID